MCAAESQETADGEARRSGVEPEAGGRELRAGSDPGRDPDGTLVRVILPVEGLGPEHLLAGAAPPRGLWRSGDRWCAFAGAVERLTTPPGRERFDRAREGAERLFSRISDTTIRVGAAGEPGPGSAAPGLPPSLKTPRLYGGFAFEDDHRAAERWEGFPAGLFVLPELELRGRADEDRAWLILTAEPGGSGPGGSGRAEPGAEGTAATGSGSAAAGGDGADPGARLREIAARLETAWEPVLPAPAGLCRDEPADPAGRARWEEDVRDALEAIREGELAKVVLARPRDVELSTRPGAGELAARLLRCSGAASFPYLFEPSAGVLLLGAAPEMLASLRGRSFRATAVAGTTRRTGDPGEDARLARRLMESVKEREEHAIGVRDMAERLRGTGAVPELEEEPAVLRLPGVQHLRTELTAEVASGTHVLGLVEALHPTAAVNGHPREASLRFLRNHERFRRGWYAGPVGWLDAAGDGEFVPALRCALLRGRQARLFAGAGLVEGSRPAEEWDETGVKFAPVLRVLGVRASRAAAGAVEP